MALATCTKVQHKVGPGNMPFLPHIPSFEKYSTDVNMSKSKAKRINTVLKDIHIELYDKDKDKKELSSHKKTDKKKGTKTKNQKRNVPVTKASIKKIFAP